MISNANLINAFLKGDYATNGSMHTDGTRLFSYATCIAQKTPDGMIFNACKYSPTTSKQQTYTIRAFIDHKVNYKTIDSGVLRGEYDLARHIKKAA